MFNSARKIQIEKKQNFVKINGKSLVDRALSIAKKIKNLIKLFLSTDNKQF